MSKFVPACRVAATCRMAVAVLMLASQAAWAQDSGEGGSIGGSIAPSAPGGSAAARHRGPTARPVSRRGVRSSQADRSAGRRADRRGGGGNFDGTWSVSAGGSCASAGTTQVVISGGRIMGQNGRGSVSPSGAVQTIGSINGLTVTARGRISGTSASGSYRQSDGCSGPWSGYKL